MLRFCVHDAELDTLAVDCSKVWIFLTIPPDNITWAQVTATSTAITTSLFPMIQDWFTPSEPGRKKCIFDSHNW